MPQRSVNTGIGIDPANARFDRGEVVRRDQIGLVEQHDVGETKLLLRLRSTIDLTKKVLGVDHGHNGIELGPAADIFIDKKCLRDGRGIGQPGRLHDDTIHAAPAPHQAAKNSYEIATHRAADAAVVHFENFFFRIDDEIIVNSDLAEFIDNDGIALAVRLREDPVEQRGLSRPEITGDHRDGSLVQSRLHGIFLC
jgi:hypothetical protein